jgi:predicted AAA+ superfamily ATPase
LLNYADLARDTGVSPNTVKNWVSLLVTSGVLSLVEGWYANASSRLVKSPKAYFNDSGLLCSLLGIRSREAMLNSPLFGAIWETWCFAQLRGWLLNRGPFDGNVHYWRTKEGKEVDFLIADDSAFYAFECKTREIPTESDARNLDLFARSRHGALVRRTVLCRTPDFIERIPALDALIDNACNLDRIFSIQG